MDPYQALAFALRDQAHFIFANRDVRSGLACTAQARKTPRTALRLASRQQQVLLAWALWRHRGAQVPTH